MTKHRSIIRGKLWTTQLFFTLTHPVLWFYSQMLPNHLSLLHSFFRSQRTFSRFHICSNSAGWNTAIVKGEERDSFLLLFYWVHILHCGLLNRSLKTRGSTLAFLFGRSQRSWFCLLSQYSTLYPAGTNCSLPQKYWAPFLIFLKNTFLFLYHSNLMLIISENFTWI